MRAGRKRELVDYVRRYSIDELGLDIGSAFEREDDSTHAYHVVAWSHKANLRYYWRIFADRDEAWLERKMKKQYGYDTFARVTEAFGGAGMYCPITKSLLRQNPHVIAFMVVHEKWHDYVAGCNVCGNTMIDEAAGDAMGIGESINIMELFYGKDSQEYKKAIEQREKRLASSKIIKSLAESLNGLYRLGRPEPEILAEKKRMLGDFNRSKECERLGHRISNNAELADLYLYAALYPLADNIYQAHGKGAKAIFEDSMKMAKRRGFGAGVKELIRRSDLDDKEEYEKVADLFDMRF